MKLAPERAASYDALGAALPSGVAPANLTASDRKRTIKALRTATELYEAGGRDVDTSAAATAHYKLSLVLAADPGLEVDGKLQERTSEILAQAVHHVRAAASLDPSMYADAAKHVKGWEEAERLNKEADRRSRLDREAMVRAMEASSKQRQLEADEDIAFEAEEAESKRQERERARRLRARANAHAHKEDL